MVVVEGRRLRLVVILKMAEKVIAIGDSDVLLINEQYQRRLGYDNDAPVAIWQDF